MPPLQATSAERLLGGAGVKWRADVLGCTFLANGGSRLKQALAFSPTPDPLKRSRDALQARAVGELVEEIMLHMRGT